MERANPRLRIEAAAGALFRERGYAATSVREIARALDVQGASLYAHVASKEEVLWGIVERAADRFDAAVAPIADGSGPAASRLRAMIDAHVSVVTSDLELASVFLHEWRSLSPERRAAVVARRDRYEARFRTVVEVGIDEGEFRDVDVPLTVAALLGALNAMAGWYRPEGRASASEIASVTSDLVLTGLQAPQP
jgi:AcrR family transcriptional regulator